MADPVSWLMIEPGWTVVAGDGTEVGRVEEVVGDADSDIFNGLAVSTGVMAKPKYVPAEQVSEITEGQVALNLAPAAVEWLRDHEPPPPSGQVRPR